MERWAGRRRARDVTIAGVDCQEKWPGIRAFPSSHRRRHRSFTSDSRPLGVMSGKRARSLSGGDIILPAYLARHVDIGFGPADVSALISSIDASQDRETSGLAHLPAEILFRIVEYVPVDYILPWRLVCRGVRDCIDGPVLFSYLKRAELIGYLGPPTSAPLHTLDEEAYDKISILRCKYERLETSTPAADSRARWQDDHAVFRIDDAWQHQFTQYDELFRVGEDKTNWDDLLRRLQLEGEVERYAELRWCLQLDGAVLDLEFPIEAFRDNLHVDLTNGRVMLQWRGILLRFLKTEMLLRSIMEQKRDSVFTYSHQEDCLRETRRRRLRTSLHSSHHNYSLIRWGWTLLPALFGQRNRYQAAETFRYLEHAEQDAIDVLTTLRREAGMSEKESNRLKQLVRDRNQMAAELDRIETIYQQWKTGMGGDPATKSPIVLPSVKLNPFAWSDAVRKTEEERVRKWKAQQENMQQVAFLLEASTEAVALPENAFDELGSDI